MTDIVCILDRSGSMSRVQDEVLTHFNAFLAEQRALPDKARLTLVLFDDKYDIVHDRVPIKDVPDLTKDVYFARGMTALNDAVGRTLKHFEPKGKKTKVLVLIQTDGEENNSTEYRDTAAVKALVEEKQAAGWNFLFVSAGIDAFKTGGSLGISGQHLGQTTHDAHGYANLAASYNVAATSLRSTGWVDYAASNAALNAEPEDAKK